jgi:hypothetical protein
MTTLRFTLLLGFLAGAVAARAAAEENNVWPFWVGDTTNRAPAPDLDSWTALGPFFYSQPTPAGETVGGFRPFYIKRTGASGQTAEVTVLYPLFYYRSYGANYEWSLFKLINRYGSKDGAPPTPRTDQQTFDVWPFYFSRNTGDPATSYHALLPIAGDIQDRFGFDRISWDLFPLYLQTSRHGAVKTSVPWPIFSVTRGTENGFGIWPLFGRTDGPGHLHREFFLWPLGWDNAVAPAFNAPDGAPPTRQVGLLPFYTGEHGAGFDSENYLWPFFGYTRRAAPRRYDEDRYFWPFLVQGRGEHYVNRWGPVYTHSVIDGMDKTWILWPLCRQARWTDDAVTQTKTQFFYFLYWSLKQRSATNPAIAPAEKVHWWPLFSSWDNGAGHRQFQVLDPLEVFFPSNDDVRQAWTPFFTLFRYDEQAFGGVRGSLFWNGITWNRDLPQGRSDFHVGPLLSVERRPDGQRVAVGDGLIGLKRRPDGSGWHFFLFEFSKNMGKTASP